MDHSSIPSSNGQPTDASEPRPSFPRILWGAWNAYAHRAAGYQAEILLSAIYFLVVGPTIIGTRLAGLRLLDLDMRPRRSYWTECRTSEKTVAALERQF